MHPCQTQLQKIQIKMKKEGKKAARKLPPPPKKTKRINVCIITFAFQNNFIAPQKKKIFHYSHGGVYVCV